MKNLRLFLAGLIVLLFSGALTPVTFASATDTSGLRYEAFFPISSANPNNPDRSATYALCSSGTVSQINHSFGSSIFGCPGDYVMVHYFGYISYPTDTTVTFRARADDGFYLEIDGNTVFNDWRLKGCSSAASGSFAFQANQWYPIDAWFYEWGGGACSILDYDAGAGWNVVPNSMLDQVGIPPITFSDSTLTGTVRRGTAYSSGVTAEADGVITYSITNGSGSLPDGLELDSETGVVSGTPTTYGVYEFSITASSDDPDYTIPATTETLTILVGDPPDLSAVTLQEVLIYNTTMTPADVSDDVGYPAPDYLVSDGSPAGISLNANTGVLSGAPTSQGPHQFTVTAENALGSSTSGTLSLTVNRDAFFPAEYDNLHGYTFVGDTLNPYSSEITAQGYPAPQYSIIDDPTSAGITALPPGLSIHPTTGRITGVATAIGTFPFRVQAHNDVGPGDSTTPQTIVVASAPTVTFDNIASNAYLGVEYNQRPTFSGYPTPTFTISGDLPSGLSLSEDGTISGKPTKAGVSSFRVCAAIYDRQACTKSITVQVYAEPVYKDNVELPAIGQFGTAFNGRVNFHGLVESYRVAEHENGLPQGLTLSPTTGVIAGIPEQTGIFRFKVTARGPTGLETTSPEQVLTVNRIPTVTDKAIVSKTNVDEAYADAVIADAFPAATYSVSAGALPTGITLNTQTGAISGTPTVTGEFSFTVTAKNVLGNASVPLTLSVLEPPSKPILTLPPNAVVGETVNGYTAVEGYPEPTFFVASGSLPSGLSLNRTTGKISGSPDDPGKFTFTIGALSSAGSNTSSPTNFEVFEPGANFDVKASVGDEIAGAAISVQSEGLMPNVAYKVVLRSTPQTVASGTTTRNGSILANFVIPNGLEPGWHSLTLTTEGADGSPFEEVAWFEITGSGVLEAISETQPSAAEMKNALTDDEAFYEDMGIDPGTQVSDEVVQETVAEVTSVVASVALVSAAAAATAAVASASAAAAAASAAGAASSAGAAAGAAGGASSAAGGTSSSSSAGARTAGAGGGGASSSGGSSGGGGGGSARGGSAGGSSGGSSGGSGGGGSSGGSGGSGGDGSAEDADYGSLEVEADDFETDHRSWGDKLAWWSIPLLTMFDSRSVVATHWAAKFSPVLSRIINDGSYLRAMVGSLMGVVYVVALLLGAFAVNPGAEQMALSGNVALLTAIVVLGAFDAFAGILGMSAFTIATLANYPITDLGDLRYLLAVFISGFAPIILSTTFRKIRRPHMETRMDVWERVVDVFMIAFVASLTTLSLIGGIAAYAGASVPLADNANTIVVLVTAVALVRIALEELAARGFADRLDRINPTEVAGPPTAQQWVSLVFKYAVLVIMIGDMVGWGWWLWLGSFVMFIPGIMGMTLKELPKSKLLSQIIPGGLAALLFATLLSTWSSDLVGMFFGDSEMYGQLSFLLVPLPVIITAIVGMFADGSEKWYVARKLTWVYMVGGIGVYVSTVLATDFFGQIFGS